MTSEVPHQLLTSESTPSALQHPGNRCCCHSLTLFVDRRFQSEESRSDPPSSTEVTARAHRGILGSSPGPQPSVLRGRLSHGPAASASLPPPPSDPSCRRPVPTLSLCPSWATSGPCLLSYRLPAFLPGRPAHSTECVLPLPGEQTRLWLKVHQIMSSVAKPRPATGPAAGRTPGQAGSRWRSAAGSSAEATPGTVGHQKPRLALPPVDHE